MAGAPLRSKRRPLAGDERLVGNGQDREVERGILQPPRLVHGDVHSQLLEEAENGPGLRRARRVVIAGDQHDRRFGQRLAESLKLLEGEDDRGVGGSDGVEEVAGEDDRVRARGDDPVHGEPEGAGDVGLSLVDAGRDLTMVLPNSQVGIGEVGQSHTGNVM